MTPSTMGVKSRNAAIQWSQLPATIAIQSLPVSSHAFAMSDSGAFLMHVSSHTSLVLQLR